MKAKYFKIALLSILLISILPIIYKATNVDDYSNLNTYNYAMQSYEEKLKIYEEEYQQYSQELENYNKQLEENKRLVAENKDLEMQYNQAMQDYNNRLEENKRLKEENAKLLEDYNQKLADYNKQLEDNALLEEDNKRLEAQYNQALAEYNKQLEENKRLEAENKELEKQYNQAMQDYNNCIEENKRLEAENKRLETEYNQSVEKYNQLLKEYNLKIEEYNKILAQMGVDKDKEGHLSVAVGQGLVFLSEPNAKISIDGGIATDMTAQATYNVVAGGGAVAPNIGRIMKKGDIVTVTYTNFVNSSYMGKPITKMVTKFSLSPKHYQDDGLLFIYNDPANGFMIVNNPQNPAAAVGGATAIRSQTEFYYDNDELITFSSQYPAVISIASLNKNCIPHLGQMWREEIIDHNFTFVPITGSCVSSHTDGIYSDAYTNAGNGSGNGFDKGSYGEWDTPTSPNYWRVGGAGIIDKGSVIDFTSYTHGLNETSKYMGNQWTNFTSKVPNTTLPLIPKEPTKPNLPNYHEIITPSQPVKPNYHEIVNPIQPSVPNYHEIITPTPPVEPNYHEINDPSMPNTPQYHNIKDPNMPIAPVKPEPDKINNENNQTLSKQIRALATGVSKPFKIISLLIGIIICLLCLIILNRKRY